MATTPRLQRILERAGAIAAGHGHRHLGLEHLLAALLEDAHVADHHLRGVDVAELRDRLDALLTPEADPRHPDAPVPWGSVLVTDDHGNVVVDAGGRAVQYLVDAEGEPVLDESGRHLHVAWNDDGEPLTGDDGRFVLRPVEVPTA